MRKRKGHLICLGCDCAECLNDAAARALRSLATWAKRNRGTWLGQGSEAAVTILCDQAERRARRLEGKEAGRGR